MFVGDLVRFSVVDFDAVRYSCKKGGSFAWRVAGKSAVSKYDEKVADDFGKLTDHVSLGALTKIVPRYVVDDVLAETDSVEKPSRLLPAHVVVYFVLALSLFTDGYEEQCRLVKPLWAA